MANIFLIHGTYGHPNENWFPWLKIELEKLNHKVFVPAFPTPKNQSIESWLDAFRPYQKFLKSDSIVVGHSLGAPFLLTIIEQLKKPIKQAFFVAGFVGLLDIPYDLINKSISLRKFDWHKINQNCKSFILYASDNDPYVPLPKARQLAADLNAKLNLISGAGHFNEKSGYTKFPELLQKIKEEL